jgi:sugar lactone lactonase YvrE
MRVDPDGTVTVLADDMLFPNGPTISADGATLIVAETAGSRFTEFALDDDGAVTARGVWAQVAQAPPLGPIAETLPQLKFGPDGSTLDADGCIWAADAVGARCARIAPGGEIVDEIHGPDGLGIFACMLGGADGRELMLCAAPDFFAANRASKRDAVLFSARVEVPHAGLP